MGWAYFAATPMVSSVRITRYLVASTFTALPGNFPKTIATTAFNAHGPPLPVSGHQVGGKRADLHRQPYPDVTRMDLRLPEMSGVEATAAISAQFPGARILVMSAFDGDEEIYRALQAGARGYLLKSNSPQELL